MMGARDGVALVVVWGLLVGSGCAAPSRIVTRPAGALVYVNGEPIGRTPLVYDDGRGLPRRYHVEIFREGCEPVDLYLDTRMSYGWGVLSKVLFVPGLWAWSLAERYVFTLQGGPDCVPRPDDLDDWYASAPPADARYWEHTNSLHSEGQPSDQLIENR